MVSQFIPNIPKTLPREEFPMSFPLSLPWAMAFVLGLCCQLHAVDDCFIKTDSCKDRPPGVYSVNYQFADLLGNPIGAPVAVTVKCETNKNKRLSNIPDTVGKVGYSKASFKCGDAVTQTAITGGGITLPKGSPIDECGAFARGKKCTKPTTPEP